MSPWKIPCLSGQGKALSFALLALFAMLSSMIATSSVLAASHTTSPDFAKVDTFITTGMQEKRIPGVELAVVQNDQVVHLRGFGRANKETGG